jgi:hypothetical protein
MFRRRQTGRVEVFRRESELASASNFLRFPDQPNPHSMLLVFKDYDFRQGFGEEGGSGTFSNLLQANVFAGRSSGQSTNGVELRGVNSVELPFPRQLVDSSNLRINTFERDIATEQIAQRLNNYIEGGASTQSIANIPDIIQNMGAGFSSMLSSAQSGGLNNLVQGLLGTSIADTATAAQYLLRKNLPGDIQRSINNVTGQAINPRETLAFEGVNLRTHQFNWDLYPSNISDSERIREIVAMIKRRVLPVTKSIATVSKAFLKYPSTVEIYLIGINREYFMKFKPAMVTSFTVDYGAGGNMAFMKGGKPAAVNISLALSEMEIETAEDYGAESGGAWTPRAASTTEQEAIAILNREGIATS